MVKGNPKSSATSATRKKHAKKHTPADDPPEQNQKRPKGKAEKGGKKSKEIKVKMYIPPIKPAPPQPDPLETTGLAHILPADLLVLLRNMSKKAQVTKIRALEELQSGWVDKCVKDFKSGKEDSEGAYVLGEMLPVWLHHIPSLFVNPSRRVRLAAVSLHASFLQIPPVRDQILFFLRETASASQAESILGTWCLAAYDIDRAVATVASASWKESIITTPDADSSSSKHLLLDESYLSSVNLFTQRAVLDPAGVYLYLNPPAPQAPPPPVHAVKKGGKASALSTPRRDDTGDSTPRLKADEQDESDQDRSARLRIGGLGAARWALGLSSTLSEDLTKFFSNPAVWTSLHPNETNPWLDIESFGFAQPNVRKATWTLLQSLISSQRESIQTALPVISTAVLRSAWIETDTVVQTTMWQPLLTFVKHYPQSWSLASASEDAEESEDENAEPKASSSKSKSKFPAYQEFLQFLQFGCSGSPQQGYPTVVVIISTIPSSIIIDNPSSDPSESPLTQFFSAFWSAIDGRALSSLHRAAVSAAFLSSLLECMVFLIRRIKNDTTKLADPSASSSVIEPEDLVKQQFSRIWEEFSSKKLKVEDRAAARLLGKCLESLAGIDSSLYDAAWSTLSAAIKTSSGVIEHSTLVASVLKVLYDRFDDGTLLKKNARSLLVDVLTTDASKCEAAVRGNEESSQTVFTLLVSMFEHFREGLFFDPAFSDKFDALLLQNSFQVLSLSPSLLLSYLLYRKDETKSLALWHSLLASIASSYTADNVPDLKSVSVLLDAARKGSLPKYLKPRDAELDQVVGGLLEKALAGPKESESAVSVNQILVCSEYFISPAGLATFLQVIVASFTSNVQRTLQDGEVNTADFEVSTFLLESVFTSSIAKDEPLVRLLLPQMFLFAYLLPISANNSDEDDEETVLLSSQLTARTLWNTWLKSDDESLKVAISYDIKERLKGFIRDTKCHPSPSDIIQLISQSPPGLHVDILVDLFPLPQQLDAMLDSLSPDLLDVSLCVLDELLPTSTKKQVETPPSTDRHGFSSYARIVHGLLRAFSGDRQLAKRNLWAFRHVLALSLYAKDAQEVSEVVKERKNPVFGPTVSSVDLNEVIGLAKPITVYLLNSISNDAVNDAKWRSIVVDRISSNQEDATKARLGLTTSQTFLLDVIFSSKSSTGIRDVRILRQVLTHLLDEDMTKEEADSFIQLARKLEKTAPETSLTIVSAIANTGVEPPKLERYRNELAASLLGVKPNKANSEGLLTLRKLAASAPPQDSDVEFLPTPRAVNLIKACQAWFSADTDEDEDEVSEEVEVALLPILTALAPILQNVAGGHWAFAFDVLEGILDRAANPDPESDDESLLLVSISRAIKFVLVLEDLSKRNKSLREEWVERRMQVLRVIRDLDVLANGAATPSKPRTICRELVLSIVQHLPQNLIDQDTLPKMVHLIQDPQPTVQKMAYSLLKTAATKRTEHFVIEAGVDTEDTVDPKLPDELLEIIERHEGMYLQGQDADDEGYLDGQDLDLFGYLLAWMLVFDSFQDSSFKVRASYIDHLRKSDLVVGNFIPIFLATMRLNRGALSKAFKLDIWGVDSFYIDHYQPGNPHTLPVLTAHVYYRALLTIPSFFHTWILDCKDRQLTNVVMTYTSTHFSPVLIRAELEHVRANSSSSPSASAASGSTALSDDNMSIKVAPAINEVSAAYSVDEHQLEIKIKIPSDWPLHKVEVRDVKRVGVDENRWRAWVLGVQQTIWAHNGRIVDGLGLFKKNVTLHFEGQVECAICYSIISVMDGSLPKKPCKTCKNRFHGGCLYKWFNTSHSSSCPLCRSDII